MRMAVLDAALRSFRTDKSSHSDAELLQSYQNSRSSTDFELLVSRHGVAVRSVCRARLGDVHDADDAFQAVFLILARDADGIRDPNLLAGWLYRVAHLICLKARRREALRKGETLPEEIMSREKPPTERAEATEFRAILSEEICALDEKSRSVIILCVLEGLTAAEAAVRLGKPKGTVDTRLAAAKKKLRDRLLKRGVVAAFLALWETTLAESRATDFAQLISPTAAAAVRYATTGLGLELTPIVTLAEGVKPLMTLTTRLIVTGVLIAGLLGAAGVGVHQMGAQEHGPAVVLHEAAPTKTAPTSERKPSAAAIDAAATREALARPWENKGESGRVRMALFAACSEIETQASTRFSIEMDAFAVRMFMQTRESNANRGKQTIPYDSIIDECWNRQVVVNRSEHASLDDVLTDVIHQVDPNWGYRVCGRRVIIGPGYVHTTFSYQLGNGSIDPDEIPFTRAQQFVLIFGNKIAYSCKNKPLEEVLEELQAQTGRNIVLDARCRATASTPITVNLADVNLLHALETLTDMSDLAAVWRNNVYYVTTPENAKRIEERVALELYGRPFRDTQSPRQFGIGGTPTPQPITPQKP